MRRDNGWEWCKEWGLVVEIGEIRMLNTKFNQAAQVVRCMSTVVAIRTARWSADAKSKGESYPRSGRTSGWVLLDNRGSDDYKLVTGWENKGGKLSAIWLHKRLGSRRQSWLYLLQAPDHTRNF